MSAVLPAPPGGGRALAWTAGVLSAAYVVVTVLAARHVTFYWDDYFLLLALDDRGLGGALLTGINGNWWPLATVLLWLQVAVFGGAYPAYLATNAVLVVVAAWAAWFAAVPLARRRPWLLAAALAAVSCSLGLVVNVTVMTASWPLALALAMVAAALAVRGRPVWVWGAVLGLALIAESGLFAVLCVVVGVLVVCARAAGRPGWLPTPRDLVLPVVLAAVGAAGTVAGYVIATRDPIDYYGTSTDSAFTVGLPSLLGDSTAYVATWMATPLAPPLLTAPAASPWFAVLVATHLVAAAAGLVAAAAVVAGSWRRRRDDPEARERWGRMVAAGLFVVPVVETAIVLAVARPGSGLEPRYAILWLLPAALAWTVLLQARPAVRWLRALREAGTALLVLGAAWCVVLLPWTFGNAFDVDNARSQASADQLVQMERCRAGLGAVANPAVSPGLRDDLLCQVVRFVDRG